jgi:hypothetical protein
MANTISISTIVSIGISLGLSLSDGQSNQAGLAMVK